MTKRQTQSLARLQRAVIRLEEMPYRPVPPRLKRCIAQLRASVERLVMLNEEQLIASPGNSTEGSDVAHLRRKVRREYLIDLSRECRRLFVQAPEARRIFRVPHATASHATVVAAAEAMIKFIKPYRRLVLDAGIEPAFLAELRDHTRTLRRLTTTSSERQARFRRASQALREELAAANELLRIIDGQMIAWIERMHVKDDYWKNIMRVPKPLGRPKQSKRADQQKRDGSQPPA
ncbi:MAG TPA: hypothetical protein VJU87_11765 [Gemmatimonadaceae bacterium]|nr:hypothetical protein [Gemmatimonadaceae bacterium]